MSIDPPPPMLPPLEYASADVGATDRAHLSTLAICHYIWGGLLGFFACFGLLYIVMGIAALNGAFPMPPTATTMPNAFPDRMFGIMFIVMGSIFSILGWSIAGCSLASGRSISKRRGRMFSIVVAAINCLAFPFGTVLGVFTLVLLVRPSVHRQYEEAATG